MHTAKERPGSSSKALHKYSRVKDETIGDSEPDFKDTLSRLLGSSSDEDEDPREKNDVEDDDEYEEERDNEDNPFESIKPMAGVSKELLERERMYIQMNRSIQAKTVEVVKTAESLVVSRVERLDKLHGNPIYQKSGKEMIDRPRTSNTVRDVAAGKAAENQKGPGPVNEDTLRTSSSNTESGKKFVTGRPNTAPHKQNGIEKSNDIVAPHDNGEGMASETVNRFLRAKLAAMQEEMNKLVAEKSAKEGILGALEEKLKVLDEEKSKMSKSLSAIQGQLEKAKAAAEEMKIAQSGSEADSASLRKQLEASQRTNKQLEAEVSAREAKLNRALQEMERLKVANSKTKAEAKEKLEESRANAEKLFGDYKKIERQKAELLHAFKKQMQLIDVLKRQKMHLEAVKLLDFTEDDFVRALKTGSTT
ncbi:hypothetical protein BJ742DRAFT_888960 [Cladochytrium replicatum]|nr:hypothetical protein BJ742DRAFT_888960 [Cladochytrium replicatum]